MSQYVNRSLRMNTMNFLFLWASVVMLCNIRLYDFVHRSRKRQISV